MIVKARTTRKPGAKHITAGQLYPVIGIEAEEYRIIDDEGRPYLYSPELFDIIDNTVPHDWVTEYGEDGERYAYPRPLNRVGFFEDYHDGDRKAVTTFWRVVNRWLTKAG